MFNFHRFLLALAVLGVICSDLWSQGLVINEASTAVGSEFFEFVVVGATASGCEEVSLGGYIFDDNNGLFVDCANAPQALAGIGVSDGFIRFSSSPFWDDVDVGTIIVIYPPGGLSDLDFCDGVVTMPVDQPGLFEENTNTPFASNSGSSCQNRDCVTNIGDPTYDLSSFTAISSNPFIFIPGTPSTLIINPNDDAWQIRLPDATFFHGIAYGTGNVGSCGSHPGMTGGPDNLLFTVGPAYQFLNTTSDDFRNASNWSNNQTPSPGEPNNCDNAQWIASMRPVVNQEFVDAGCVNMIPASVVDTICLFTSFQEIVQSECSSTDYSWTYDVAKFSNIGPMNTNQIVLEAIDTGLTTVTLLVTRDNAALSLSGTCSVENTATVEWTVYIEDTPEATLVPIPNQCAGGGFFDADSTASSTSGGVYSITPSGSIDPASGIIDLSTLMLGMYTVAYTVITCDFASAMESFMVVAGPSANAVHVSACLDSTSFDLTLYNDSISVGSTITYYDGDPAAGGMLITPPTNVDLTLLSGLYAIADDGTCMDTVMLTYGYITGIDTSNFMCNDNFTPLDASDDSLSFDLIVNAVGMSGGYTITTSAGAITPNMGTYNTSRNHTLSGFFGSGDVTLFITDNANPGCVITIVIPDPGTCASCALSAMILDTICDNNGTPMNPSDDTYTFNVIVTGVGTSASWTTGASISPTVTGAYGVVVTFGPYPISGGQVNFFIQDAVQGITCQIPMNIPPPLVCSCDMNFTPPIAICNDNGTPADSTDDFFYFDLTVNNNAPGGWYADDGPPATTGVYGTATRFDSLPYSGGPVTIVITDNDSTSCSMMFTVNPPPTRCSNACSLMTSIDSIWCDDPLNTPFDPSDDVFYFLLTVTGDNTSAQWQTFDNPPFRFGSYGVAEIFGPYNVVDPFTTITIVDAALTVSCQTFVDVIPPTIEVPMPPSIGPFCEDDAAVTLLSIYNGIPGTWSGTGIVAGPQFDPGTATSVGSPHTLTFTPDAGECAISATLSVVVDPMVSPNLTGMGPYCETDPAVPLVSPQNGLTGTWTGTGVVGGQFDPSAAGSNPNVLTFTPDAGQCGLLDTIHINVNSAITPVLTGIGPFCESDGAVALPTSPSGISGNWSGPGVSANQFDPSSAGPGGSPHTLLFTPDAGECAYPDSISVIVDAESAPMLTAQGPFCETDISVALPTLQDGINGNWSGTGVTGNTFDPSVGSGGSPYTLLFTPDAGQCAIADSIMVTVDSLYIPVLSVLGPFCETDMAVNLATTQDGVTGTWSGTGVTANQFDPTIGSGGSPYTLTFTPTVGQCATLNTIDVVVNPSVSPMLDPIGPFCENDASVALSTTQDGVMGTWSGPGVSSNQFDPGVATGTGSPHTLTFTPNAGVCAVVNTIMVTVDSSITPMLDPLGPFCAFGDPVDLDTMQDGITGNWFGTGVVANQYTPAGAGGPFPLSFFPDPGQCANPSQIQIYVVNESIPMLTAIGPFCVSDAVQTLDTIQDGFAGSWSGNGVSGNQFDPSTAGSAGSPHTLTFTPNAGECALVNDMQVTVTPEDPVTLTGIGPFCETDAVQVLVTTQDGYTGNWSGTGVTSNMFDPSVGSAGSPYILTFTPTAGQCAETDTIHVIVTPAVVPALTGIGPFCELDGAVALNTTQDGIMGTWTGTGVSGNQFDPSVAGSAGSPFTLTFTPLATECAQSNTIQVVVNAAVTPALDPLGPFCENASLVVLSTTQNGITGNWSGSGVNMNQFDPSIGAGGSPYTLTFMPDAGQCAQSNTIQVVVDNSVIPVLTGIGPFCETDAAVTLATIQDGIMGTWTGAGMSGNQFDPAVAGSGGSPHTLTFTPDAGECAESDSIQVIVNAEDIPLLTPIGPFCETDTAVMLNTTQDGYTGTWSGPGVSANQFNPMTAGWMGSPHMLVFTPNAGQCAQVDSIAVVVTEAILPMLSPIGPFCDSSSAVTLSTIQSGINGSWTGTGVTGNMFDPMAAGAGSWTLTFTPDMGQCAVLNTMSVTVNQCSCPDPPTADAGVDTTICETDSVTVFAIIGGSATLGTWSTSGDGTFDNPTALMTIYRQGSTDISNGTVTLTLTTDDPDGAGPCLSTSDQLVVTIMQLVTPILDPIGPFCISDMAVNLLTTQDGIMGNWSGPGVSGNQFDPMTAGSGSSPHTLLFTPDAGQCADTNSIQVIVDSLLIPMLTGIGPFCEIDAAVPLSDIQDGINGTWTGPGISGGNFDPMTAGSGGSPHTLTFTPDTAQCADVSTMEVIVTAALVPALTTIGPFCTTDTAVVLDTIQSGIDGVWSGTGVVNGMFDPMLAGSGSSPYTLTFTPDGGQCAVSDTIVVVVMICNCANPPTVDAGPDTTICETEIINLFGVIGGSASSATWTTNGDGTFGNTTALATDYTPGVNDLASGTVTLTLTTDDPDGVGPCVAESSSLLITIAQEITPMLTAIGPYCESETMVSLDTIQNGIIGSWTGTGVSNNIFDPSVGAGGSPYTLTFTPFAGECALPNTIQVVVEMEVTPMLMAIGPFCELDSAVVLDTIQNGIDGVWSGTGVVNGTFDPMTAGAGGPYTLTFTPDTGQCAAMNTLQVDVSADITPVLASLGPFCSTDTAVVLDTIQDGVDGVWSGTGVVNGMFDPIAAGTGGSPYTLTFTPDAGQCAMAVTTQVVVEICNCPDPPTANAGADTTICETELVNLLGMIGGSATTGVWSTSGDGTFSDTTTLSSVYTPGTGDITGGTVTITLTTDDPDGVGPCTPATDNLVITIASEITPMLIAIGPFCELDTAITLDTIQDGIAGTWSGPGVSGVMFDPMVAGSAGPHTLTFTPHAGQCALMNTMQVDVSAALVPTLIAIGPFCSTDTAVFLDTIQNGVDGTWSGTGVVNGMFDPIGAGTGGSPYTLTFTPDAGPCITFNTIQVVVEVCNCTNPPTADAGADTTICEDELLNLIGVIGGSATSAVWSTNGDGTFGNVNSLMTTYTPGATDISGGTVTLTLTTNDPDGVGPCVPDMDDIVVTITQESTPMLTGIGPFCSLDDPENLNTTQDGVTGNWSGTGVSANVFDPSIGAGGSPYTLTFTPDAGQCAAPGDIQVVVNDETVPTLTAIGPFCETDTAISLNTTQSGITGNWSGAGVMGNEFDPTTGSAGSPYTLTFTPDTGQCATINTLQVIVEPAPTPILDAIGPFCETDSAVSLSSIQDGVNGTWSGPGVSANEFDPMIAGSAGSPHALTFTPDAGICALPNTIQVVVDALVTPMLTGIGPFCETDAAVSLNTTQDGIDGNWSGPGVTGNQFNPMTAGSTGSPFTLTFTPDAGQCAMENTIQVVVDSSIIPMLTPIGPFCEDSAAVMLPTTQDGINGNWSGTGVSGNSFDPTIAGPGTWTLSFTPDPGQCASIATMTVIVNQCNCPTPPTADAGNDITICEDEIASIAGSIGGSASTGTWSTNGDGTFANVNALATDYTPGTNDIMTGTVTLTLTTDDPDGAGPCVESSDQLIVTIDAEAVPILDQIGPFCDTDTAVTLNLIQDGITGTWGGPGVVGNQFDPMIAGSAGSPHTLTFTPDAGQCATTNTIAVVIDPSPIPALTPIGPFCETDGPFPLNTTQDGIMGNWSGDGVSGNQFNPMTAGSGGSPYILTFTPLAGQCAQPNTLQVVVTAAVAPVLTPIGPFCELEAAVALNDTQSMILGMWSGPGVTGNQFDPMVAGSAGSPHTLTFTPDAGQCAQSNTIQVIVNAAALPNLTPVGPLCETDAVVTLNTLQDGATGNWSGTGVTANEFDPSIGAGGSPYTLTFTPDAGQCVQENTILVVVTAASTPALTVIGPFCETDAAVNLNLIQDGINGTWSGIGVVGNQFDPAAAGSIASPHTLTFTPDAGQCALPNTMMVVVDAAITPMLLQIGPFCETDASVPLDPLQDGINGSWSGTGVSGNQFNPMVAGSAGSPYTLTFTPNTGECAVVNTMQVVVDQAVVPVLTQIGPFCDDALPVMLNTLQDGIMGSWSGTGVTANEFDPMIAGPGMWTLTFTPDMGECAQSNTIIVTVEQCNCPDPPTASAGMDQTICENEIANLSAMIGGSASSSTWSTSGDGTFGDINILITDYTPGVGDIAAGTVTLTITTDDPDGAGPCVATSSQLILTIETQVIPVLNTIGPFCETESAVALNTTQDGVMGTWSGPGVTANEFDPAVGPIGSPHTLTFTPDAGQCAVFNTITVVVNELVMPMLDPIGPLCETDGLINLNTLQNGINGDWSGIGVTANQFDPSIGSIGSPYTLTFTPIAGQCAQLNAIQVIVNMEMTPMLDPIGPLCETDGIVILNPIQNGITGLWSGPSVTGNTFNPATAGSAGSPHTLVFTPDAGQCALFNTINVVVLESILPSLDPIGPFCETDMAVALPLLQDGVMGTWSGIGVLANQFDPAAAGPVGSPHTLTFTPDVGECAQQNTINVIVNPEIVPVLITIGPFCDDDMAVMLNTTQSGIDGTWSGTGVSGNMFDPSVAGPGMWDLVFTPDAMQCATFNIINVTVEQCNCPTPPTADAGYDETICATDTASIFGAIGGAASFGSWSTSGDGSFGDASMLITSYMPGPDDLNDGLVILTLTTDDPDGAGPCVPATDQVVIFFDPSVVPTLQAVGPFCEGDPAINLLTTQNGVLGNWSGPGVTGNIFDPDNAGTVGSPHTLVFTPNAGQCAEENSIQVEVNSCGCPVVATADAGFDLMACEGDTVFLAASIGGSATSASWTTAGDGTFVDPNQVQAQYIPGTIDYMNGSVILTITTDDPDGAGPCIAATDEVEIIFSSLSYVNVNEFTCDMSMVGIVNDTFPSQQAGSCDSVVIRNIQFDMNAVDSMVFLITTCDPMEVGELRDTVPNSLGCDSINITITTLALGSRDTVIDLTCDPTAVGFMSDTFPNAAGCDSIIVTEIQFDMNAVDSMVFMVTTCDPMEVGELRDTVPNSLGCDSINITITTLALGSRDTIIDLTCDPTAVGFMSDTFPNAAGCDSIIVTEIQFDMNAVDSMVFMVTTCDPMEVGELRDTVPNSLGCDSINITITTLALGSRDTIIDLTCDPTAVGFMSDTFPNAAGCDSIIVTETQFNMNAVDSMVFMVMTCDPMEVGEVRDTVPNSLGCDSINITITTLALGSRDTLIDLTCDPAAVGFMSDTFPNAAGCDSIIVTETQFDMNAVDSMVFMVMTCDPMEVGEVRDTVPSSLGCDSINITITTLAPSTTENVVEFTCDPMQVGILRDTLSNTAGCDSIIVTDVQFNINATDTSVIDQSSCNPVDTGYFETLHLNQFGCDSLVQLTVTLSAAPAFPTMIQLVTCDANLVGIDTVIVLNGNGCDSMVITETTLGTFTVEVDPVVSNIEAGDSVLITLSSINLDLTMADILWSPSDGLSCDTCIAVVASPDESTTYFATVIDGSGCQGSAVAVVSINETEIYVPNAFSPNNDQINDVFTIYSDKEVFVELFEIYNRWGDRVFRETNKNLSELQGWSGYIFDDSASEDVYVYQIQVIVDGQPRLLKGDMTLVR